MDVYNMVTERILNQLEKGYIPWKKPWANCVTGTYNRISKKPYSILNQLLLKNDGEYATFKQWENIGGKIKKGEKSEFVVFWKLQETKVKDDKEIEKVKQVPLLRYYNVFHISQVENILPLPKTESFDTEPIEVAEKIIKDYVERENIILNIGESNRAFYRPFDDSINLPCITQFEKAEEYYSTAFHESMHSTLKEYRCNRTKENKLVYFENEDYSKEELIAEIGSSAILNYLGIETKDTFENSMAYIQNWISVLKNEKKFIVSASGKAEKATKYILNLMN